MIVSRNQRTAWKRVDGEVLVIASDTNTLTVLNETGGRLWELLERPRSVDELASLLCNEFAVDLARAAADVGVFVTTLRGKGLLVEGRP